MIFEGSSVMLYLHGRKSRLARPTQRWLASPTQESICRKKIGNYMSLNWLNKPIMRKDVVHNI